MTLSLRQLLWTPLRLMGYASTSSPYLPKEWQSPAQQEQLELALDADQIRLTFLKKAFATTFLTPQQNDKLRAMSNKDAASAYFLGIYDYLQNSPRLLHLLFKDTLLADTTSDPLTHSTLISLLSYQELMPTTLVRSGASPQSLDVAVAYKVPGWDGGFFVRQGQQLDAGSKERYVHIPNKEVIQRLKLKHPQVQRAK